MVAIFPSSWGALLSALLALELLINFSFFKGNLCTTSTKSEIDIICIFLHYVVNR